MDGHHKSGFVLLYMYSSRHQSELYAATGLVNPALLNLKSGISLARTNLRRAETLLIACRMFKDNSSPRNKQLDSGQSYQQYTQFICSR